MLSRYLEKQVKSDLNKKMVFVAGPRQVGKTTMAKHILGNKKKGYLNWDITEQREAILKHELPNNKLWVFDEIHKYEQWRNYLKGLYDQFKDEHHILVTGSAQLDYYRRGGDSLQGRYHNLRMHPLSAAELKFEKQDELFDLLKLGGFPEPYFSSEEIEAKRWSREYRQRLIQEDLMSLENIKNLGQLELLMLRLPELVGSPLSVNALREDLQVSHKAVSNWLSIFERLYAIFMVPPFGSPTIRAVKKEQKHYHFDWTLVEDEGARFENMIAMHLLKWVHYQQDTLARDVELHYFKDTSGREVDFIITESNNPIMAIECKWKNKDASKPLIYFKKKFPNCEAYQIDMNSDKDFISKEGIKICNALYLLNQLI